MLYLFAWCTDWKLAIEHSLHTRMAAFVVVPVPVLGGPLDQDSMTGRMRSNEIVESSDGASVFAGCL